MTKRLMIFVEGDTDKLSGINNRGIWINKNKLMKSKYNLKYPRRYHLLIGK